MKNFKLRYIPFWMTALGAAIAFTGILCGAIIVGVPFQDPTPEQIADQNMNDTIFKWIFAAGLILFLLGGLLIPIYVWMNRKRP